MSDATGFEYAKTETLVGMVQKTEAGILSNLDRLEAELAEGKTRVAQDSLSYSFGLLARMADELHNRGVQVESQLV